MEASVNNARTQSTLVENAKYLTSAGPRLDWTFLYERLKYSGKYIKHKSVPHAHCVEWFHSRTCFEQEAITMSAQLPIIPVTTFSQTDLFIVCVRTCELFLCFVAIVRVRAIVLTSLFYVTGEFHRFLHRGRAEFRPLQES